MTIIVERAGMLTTVQDLGRYGYQRYGVSVSGAMDPYACTVANLLVGNAASAALLEFTLTGASLTFTEPALIAICGADMQPTVHGEPLPTWRPVHIKQDTLLEFGAARQGVRAYLAVAGGLQVKKRMKSSSTYLSAGIGGYEGRALREGDLLEIGPPGPLSRRIAAHVQHSADRSDRGNSDQLRFQAARWSVGHSARPPYAVNRRLRYTDGIHVELFAEESLEDFMRESYRVSPRTDRMGCRLNGRRLRLKQPTEIWSEAVTFGTVQVPPDGEPIILTADRQTTGGYPVIGQIISVDLPLLAQTPIGEEISFERVTVREAQRLLLEARRDLELLRKGVRMMIEGEPGEGEDGR